MLKVEKVATPATAAVVVVPERVPAPGFAPIAIVTLSVNPAAVLPWASRAVTCTAGVGVFPAAVLVGCTAKPSWVAAPGAMVKAVLVAPVNPVAVAVSVYPVPLRLMLRWEKAATPATAATVVVPDSVPTLGFVPIAMVTSPVNPVARLPSASRALTATAGVIVALATVVLGCTLKTSWLAGAVATSKLLLFSPLSP